MGRRGAEAPDSIGTPWTDGVNGLIPTPGSSWLLTMVKSVIL